MNKSSCPPSIEAMRFFEMLRFDYIRGKEKIISDAFIK